MNSNINLLEYLSLFIIITFFIHHSIYLVLLGIGLSYYLLIKDSIKRRKIIDRNKSEQKSEDIKPFDEKEIIKKDSSLSLADKVEELGFIPSEDKYEKNAA